MALRQIVKEPDAILKKASRPVERFDERLHKLLDDMLETMEAAGGAGLAAVQVGVLRRVMIIDCGEGPVEFVNPLIVGKSGSQTGSEGCLSFPGLFGMVTRPLKVRVRAQDRNSRFFEKEFSEIAARAVCHECDHLDGKTFVEIATDLVMEGDTKK